MLDGYFYEVKNRYRVLHGYGDDTGTPWIRSRYVSKKWVLSTGLGTVLEYFSDTFLAKVKSTNIF